MVESKAHATLMKKLYGFSNLTDLNTIHTEKPEGAKHIATLNGNDLQTAIRMKDLCATDELRAAMTGVHFDGKYAVATDAHVLRYEPVQCKVPFTIDKHILSYTKSMKVDKIEVYQTEEKTYFNIGHRWYPSKASTQKYPDYLAVIPQDDSGTTLTFSTKDLRELVKFTKHISKDYLNEEWPLEVDNGFGYLENMPLYFTQEYLEPYAPLVEAFLYHYPTNNIPTIKHQGLPHMVKIATSKLEQFIKTTTSDTINFELREPNRVIVVTEGKSKGLIMPVMINNDYE